MYQKLYSAVIWLEYEHFDEFFQLNWYIYTSVMQFRISPDNNIFTKMSKWTNLRQMGQTITL